MRRRKGPDNFDLFSQFRYFTPNLAGIFIILAWVLVGVLIGNALSLAIAAVAGTGFVKEYGNVISYPVMFIPVMIYASVKSRANGLTSNGFKLDNSNFAPLNGAVCAIVAIASTLALSFFSDLLVSFLPKMPSWLEELLKGMTQGNLWLNFLCVSIFAPFFEEWLCRGMVLRGLLGSGMKPLWSIAISAAFFALIHMNPWQAIPAFLFGVLFGYVYYRTGSLKLTMLMHFTNNTTALVFSHIDRFKDVQCWKEVLPARIYWVIVAASAILAILSVRYFSRTLMKGENGNIERIPSMFSE